jgi:hypothetical protein
MKKYIVIAALLAATSAYATDLPNKKKAPEAPAAAAAPAAKSSTDSLTVTYGQDLGTNFGAKSNDSYGVSYKKNLGNGLSVGAAASTTQAASANLKQNIEAQVGYALPAMAGVVVSGKLGVGERFVDTGNFPYYAAYGNADYKIGSFTINAAQYRFRSAFDNAAYSYQSHQIGTGVTYDINDTYAVSAKVARSYDTSFNATGDSISGGLTVKF